MGNATKALAAIAAGHDRLETLAEAIGASKQQAGRAVANLKGRNFISVEMDPEDRRFGIYKVTKAGQAWLATGKEIKKGQVDREKTVGLRERAWWHFWNHKRATLREILSTHAEGTERDAFGNLHKYVKALEKVGILERTARKVPAKHSPGGLVQWKLVKELGPKAPVYRFSAREIFDPNSGKSFPIPEGTGDE